MTRAILVAFFTLGAVGFVQGGQDETAIQWLLDDALEEQCIGLTLPDVATPEELAQAIEDYRRGRYRSAVVKLEKLRALELPDGRGDFIYFLLGECYRMLDVRGLARERYRYVLQRFPSSDKVPPSLFRLLQYARLENDNASADSILEVFQTAHKGHTLYGSVLYTVGLLYYRTERYGEAIEKLLLIPQTSVRHYQAQFLAALCFIRIGKTDKALFHLGYVRKNSLQPRLVSEAGVVIADNYYTQGNLQTALKYYLGVTKDAPRYFYALVKTARVYMELKNYDRSRSIARDFVEKHPQSPYFFEMASILEQVYTLTGNKVEAGKINYTVYRQIIDAKLAFEIDRELGYVYDMMARWKQIKMLAAERGDNALLRDVEANLGRLGRLEKDSRKVLAGIGVLSRRDSDMEIPGLAERRYVNMLRRSVIALQDTVHLLDSHCARARTAKATPDSALERSIDLEQKRLDTARARLGTVQEEYNELKRVAWSDQEKQGSFSDEMQAKFIDWAFMRYMDKKAEMEKLTMEISAKGGADTLADSLAKRGTNVVSLFSSIDRDKLAQTIVDDRRRLIDHIETFLELNPNNIYFPQILFRLAELHYDESVEDFDKRLRVYEERMARGDADSAGLAFPEYDLSRTVDVYDRIIGEYGRDWLADDAHFYKAMAFQKLGRLKEANDVLETLVEAYPGSEYFVEANMNIGRYYFEHPREQDGKGYDLSEKAYRRVLQYRDHPQFVEALYHLGWCYYMRDKYGDAIAVFKYLIEEVDLDFDPRKMDEKQLANPLLRAEAIDYIAISFDEEGNIDEAVRFLELVGNFDYAALVLKRIGELREEDMDYKAAIDIYRRLLREYPTSLVAPEATISLIKVYETTNQATLAMKERKDFFERYAQGSAWQKAVSGRDADLSEEADSTAISMGLMVAEAQYRLAQSKKDTDAFRSAVESYRKLVDAYPDDARASEGRWNLAVILESRLNESQEAYKEYVAYSRLEGAEKTRREQSALNAIAIAQGLLPADSGLEAGKLSPAAVRVIESAQNYVDLFPQGSSLGDVVLTMGAVYFNRKMYANAAKVFKILTDRGEGAVRYYDAHFLVGKCFFGEEKWIPAADVFGQVWKGTKNAAQKEEAYTLMLQARYLDAKQLFDSEAFEKAAAAFLAIEKDYPGSDYGDVVLFSAAEAYEKTQSWIKACGSYYQLYTKYPASKFAAAALFNAATDYEKAEKYDKAAETYELLAAKYTKSEKAKDGLFNLGFCYEKLGEMEKMAEANERFTRLYPEEKDVEAMLMRSAEYYQKASMHEKAIALCRNFIRRYARNPRSVEAFFMIGKSQLAEKDTVNARLAFGQAEKQNETLVKAGGDANYYFAAEAAYQTASILRQDLAQASLATCGAKELKTMQKRKTEILAEATKAAQRVMQYQSERMFEAGYEIGAMCEEFALDWSRQKRTEKDPIKIAVAEKDINLVASSLYQKTFAPYKKVLELASKVDSLAPEQSCWVDSAKSGLRRNTRTAGLCIAKAVAAMESAPIPKQIQEQPLYLFQYRKQLLETLEPMKVQLRDYYLGASKDLAQFDFARPTRDSCLEEFSRLNYLLPNGYDKLGETILVRSEELGSGMGDEEREELVFQFEDMVFELQDKALFAYEDALELGRGVEGGGASPWYREILDRLARLSPEKYGKNVHATRAFRTDSDWYARCDSIEGWTSLDVPLTGWGQAATLGPSRAAGFKQQEPELIWSDCEPGWRAYLWKPFFLDGEPREAALHFTSSGPYRLYVNGGLVSSDTARGPRLAVVDSVTGAASLLKGGDNVVCIAAEAPDTLNRGIALVFSALVDTTRHFESSLKLPATTGPAGQQAAAIAAPVAETSAADTAGAKAEPGRKKPAVKTKQLGTKTGTLQAIADYETKEKDTQALVKRERLEVQKLQIRRDSLDKSIDEVKAQIDSLRQSLDTMQRGR